ARKERRTGAAEREDRERQVDRRARKREHATQSKELKRKQRKITQMEESFTAVRARLKDQTQKVLRSERAAAERLRAVEALERDVAKRDAAAKQREAVLKKRE